MPAAINNTSEKVQIGSAIAEAIRAVRRGWAVIPVHAPTRAARCDCPNGDGCEYAGKHPLTEHGYKDASRDEAQILAWAALWPGCNWGVVAGVSVLLIIDVDPRNEGDQTLIDLLREHQNLPDTWAVKTGGGGRHIYLSCPPGVARFDRKLGPGLEIKLNQYVVLPGSRHASGGVYEWEIGNEPEDLPIAAAPGWLVELLREEAAGHSSLAVPEHLEGFSVLDCPELDKPRLESHIEPGTRLWKIFHANGEYGHGDQSRLDQALVRELYCLGYSIYDAQPVAAHLRRLRRANVRKAYRRDYVLRTWMFAEKLGPATRKVSDEKYAVLQLQRMQAVSAVLDLAPAILGWGDANHILGLQVMVRLMGLDHSVFMSQHSLAASIGKAASTGRRVLTDLEQHRLIRRRAGSGRRGRGLANEYDLEFLNKQQAGPRTELTQVSPVKPV